MSNLKKGELSNVGSISDSQSRVLEPNDKTNLKYRYQRLIVPGADGQTGYMYRAVHPHEDADGLCGVSFVAQGSDKAGKEGFFVYQGTISFGGTSSGYQEAELEIPLPSGCDPKYCDAHPMSLTLRRGGPSEAKYKNRIGFEGFYTTTTPRNSIVCAFKAYFSEQAVCSVVVIVTAEKAKSGCDNKYYITSASTKYSSDISGSLVLYGASLKFNKSFTGVLVYRVAALFENLGSAAFESMELTNATSCTLDFGEEGEYWIQYYLTDADGRIVSGSSRILALANTIDCAPVVTVTQSSGSYSLSIKNPSQSKATMTVWWDNDDDDNPRSGSLVNTDIESGGTYVYDGDQKQYFTSQCFFIIWMKKAGSSDDMLNYSFSLGQLVLPS